MPAASGCLRLRVAPRGSPLLGLRWRALALRLAGAERCAWEPLALLLGLRAVAMVSVPLRRLTHRLPGDLLFTLLSGLISTASRRNLTNHFIAWREEPCSQSGSQACALAPVSSRLLLPMRLPSKRLLDHGTAPKRQFLLESSRAPRSCAAPKNSKELTLAVKDNIDMQGVVTTAGSQYLAKNSLPASHDAPCLATARQRNVRIVGKTNLSEFAVSPSGLNDYYGTP